MRTRPSGRDDQGAVHLRVVDVDPVATDPHLGGQVGRRVEALGQDAVDVGRHGDRVGLGQPVGAVDLQLGDESGEGVLVGGGDLETGPAGVDVGAADVDVDHAVVGAGVDDDVEHLGQDEGVDDVPLNLDDL